MRTSVLYHMSFVVPPYLLKLTAFYVTSTGSRVSMLTPPPTRTCHSGFLFSIGLSNCPLWIHIIFNIIHSMYFTLINTNKPKHLILYIFAFVFLFTPLWYVQYHPRPFYYVHSYALSGYRVSPGGWAPTFKFILNAYPNILPSPPAFLAYSS